MPRRSSTVLTASFVAKAVCPSDKPSILYRDAATAGFCLRVMPSGAKAWVVDGREADGKKFQLTLGQVGAMALEDARQRAVSHLQLVRERAEKEADNSRLTLAEALVRYAGVRSLRPSTVTGISELLDAHAADWLEKPLASIGHTAVVARVQRLWAAGTVTQGNHLVQYGRALYNALGVKPNPFAGISEKPTDQAPANPVPPEAWPVLWREIQAMSDDAKAYVLVLALTGFRPLAAMNMRWGQLTLGEAPAYRIERTSLGFKRGEAWDYPLPALLGKVLEHRRGDARLVGSAFVFPGRAARGGHSADRPVSSGFKESLGALFQRAGVRDLTPYSFRDTRASYAERLFGDSITTQRLLNHRPDYQVAGRNKATGKYVQTSPEQIRGAVERYTGALLELAGVLPMSAAVKNAFLEPAQGVEAVLPPADKLAQLLGSR